MTYLSGQAENTKQSQFQISKAEKSVVCLVLAWELLKIHLFPNPILMLQHRIIWTTGDPSVVDSTMRQ